MAQDFLSVYSAKALEYSLAIGYLLLFIPFWKYVQGGQRQTVGAEAHVLAGAERHATAGKHRHAGATRAPRPAAPGWFEVPSGVYFHPGHTWARLEADGLVAIGADDFAHKLVGAARADLPAVGAHVAQGETALAIGDDEKMVPMVSPVDGTVVAVNNAARAQPGGTSEPYGAGWLFKVKAPKLAANLRQLLADGPARRFMEEAEAQIALRVSPEIGAVLQDGGAPVHGIARALSGDKWDDLARQFFLT